MAEGDIKISRHLGQRYTTASGAVGLTITPAFPSLADHDHWLLIATIWRTEVAILNNADGPFIRSWQVILHIQDNGTNVKYNSTVNLLKAATAGDNSDTVDMDYSGGVRVLVNPSSASARQWFADIVCYRGVRTVT